MQTPCFAVVTRIATFVLISMLLVSCGGAIDAGQPSCAASAGAQKELALLNLARSAPRKCGSVDFPAVPPLTWNIQLESAAIAHSNDMATRNFMAHTNPDGVSAFQRIVAAGYSPFRSAGENIAAGYDSSEAVLQGWLTSTGHCENIMNSTYTDYAIACSINQNSDYGTYWTQTFGSK